MAFRWRLLRIRGVSMAPTLADGDYALARRLRADHRLAVGDVVETRHPRFGLIVKRVKALESAHVLLEGNATTSITSEQMGPIARSDIEARLILRISPRGMSLITSDVGK